MPEYLYKATDHTGKIVQGSMDVREEAAVISKLHSMGFIPIKIALSSEKRGLSIPLNVKLSIPLPIREVSGKDLLSFTQELCTLIKAGLPLDRSLSILVELTESEKFRKIIQELLKDVRGGRSLSDALAQHPRVFDRLFINMVKAGEAGGFMDVVLERLVDFLERSQELKSSILNAMIYPIVLVCVMGLVIAALLIFVVPRFTSIFEMMGQEIPLPTQILLSFSLMIKNFWWLIVAIGIACYIGFQRYIATENGRYSWDNLKLRLAIIRDLILKIEVARFARTLGTLITSGVPILQALAIVKEIIGNIVISNSINDIQKGVKEGKGISLPMRSMGFFPPLAMHMIRVGEETGRLDEMLLRVADTYDREMQNSIKRFIAILEPLLILIMSGIVALIVLSIIWAIFSINEMPF
jgi:general secretion pathway protein F